MKPLALFAIAVTFLAVDSAAVPSLSRIPAITFSPRPIIRKYKYKTKARR